VKEKEKDVKGKEKEIMKKIEIVFLEEDQQEIQIFQTKIVIEIEKEIEKDVVNPEVNNLVIFWLQQVQMV